MNINILMALNISNLQNFHFLNLKINVHFILSQNDNNVFMFNQTAINW